MRDRIREFFDRQMRLPGEGNGAASHADAGAAAGGRAAGPAEGRPAGAEALRRVHIAACALLLELAHADDHFSGAERMHIEAVLRRHFELDEVTARELMRLAESERESADGLHGFTDLIRASYDRGQKTLLAEIMWGLILSDGEIARHEAYVLHRIASLIDLEPGYLADVRKRAAGEDD
ncbi:MAG TPA: TerB family tellurite resistance protein [Longimicrobiales bacterium]|nr:TerB family tellurite resistance protein [Longimicrobiales bacterium]